MDPNGDWGARMEPSSIAAQVQALLADGRLDAEPAVYVHDLDRLRARYANLAAVFPANTLHGIAVKANPVVPLMRHLVSAGAGLECASIEEVHLSLAAGCAPGRVVFDSPAKTVQELRFALTKGLWLNADNFEELERIEAVVRELRAEGSDILSAGKVGLRVNPLVKPGRIGITSVGDRASKFGVLIDRADEIEAAFGRYSWLGGLHLHVGSQGCDLDTLVDGSRKVGALVARIEASRAEPLFMDLGGGLPTGYVAGAEPPPLADYVERLRQVVPRFEERQLLTEFGRALHANCGFMVSRVEYAKTSAETRFVVIHVGADGLMRPVYQPHNWPHELLVLDAAGHLVEDRPLRTVTVAGPLCFGGDLVARDVELPDPQPGDHIVVRDTGAYTMSMWSRHCSRALPSMLGVEGSPATFSVLKRRESLEDLVRFWGG